LKPKISPELKKRLIVYSIVFAGLIYALKEMESFIIKQNLSKISYKDSTIEDFYLVNKGEFNFVLEGKKFIDKKDIKKMIDIAFTMQDKNLKLMAKEADFLVKEKIIDMKKDVLLKIRKLNIKTDTLNIYLKQNLAKNNSPVLMFSDIMKTTGENIEIDFKSSRIKIKHPKTEITRGIL